MVLWRSMGHDNITIRRDCIPQLRRFVRLILESPIPFLGRARAAKYFEAGVRAFFGAQVD